MLCCSQNIHRTSETKDAKILIQNKKHMKVRKLSTQLNFQGHTQYFQNHKTGVSKSFATGARFSIVKVVGANLFYT